MKKYLYVGALIITCFTACKKDSLTKIPLETSFSDQGAIAKTFQTTLTTGDGWKAIIAPPSAGLYGGYFKFETTGDSKFLLDNSTTAATTALATKYSVSVINTNTTLSFPAVSAFATFAANATTPTNKVDTAYTFRYTSAAGDTIKLVGNLFGTSLTFIKASKAESDDYNAGKLVTAINNVANLNKFKMYYKRTTLNGKDYDLIFNTRSKVLTINYSNGGVFQKYSTYYAHTTSGIILKQPFVDGTTTISALNALTVDMTNFKATATSGATAITINNFATPVIVDLAAAKRFIANAPTYWISYTGFTVDGVPDALGVTTIPGFSFLLYNPKYNVSYDRVGFIVGGAYAAYGPAIVATYPANGSILFTYFGSFGTPPASVAAPVNNTRDKYIDAQGYYVFQTGLATYDWVSVATGRTWISYE